MNKTISSGLMPFFAFVPLSLHKNKKPQIFQLFFKKIALNTRRKQYFTFSDINCHKTTKRRKPPKNDV